MWSRVYSNVTGRTKTIIDICADPGHNPLTELARLLVKLFYGDRPHLSVRRYASQHFLNAIL